MNKLVETERINELTEKRDRQRSEGIKQVYIINEEENKFGRSEVKTTRADVVPGIPLDVTRCPAKWLYLQCITPGL